MNKILVILLWSSLFLSFACTCNCHEDIPQQVIDWQEQGRPIVVRGQGSHKRYAIADAWKQAMMKVIRANIDSDYVAANQERLEIWLDRNWQRYTTGESWQYLPKEDIIYNWDRDEREITIRVRVRESQLIDDAQRFLR